MANIKDMTKGSSVRLILLFAIPLFVGNIFQQIYNLADTMIAGYNLGDNAIAAIGATSSLSAFFIDFASGMNNGYAIVVTQKFGAGDKTELKQSIAGMMILNVVSALLLTVLSLLFLRPLMQFVNIPRDIFEEAYKYIVIICAGLVSTVFYNMFAGILRAVGNSRTSLYFLIISCLLNVGIDLLAIVVLKMGVAGAAAATVIAQSVSAVLCGNYVFRHYKSILPGLKEFRLTKEIALDLLSSGAAMGMMLCLVDLGSMIFQKANNNLGTEIIAAYAASRRLIVIMMQPFATIATASATFIGQNYGAGKFERIQSVIKKVLCMELMWALLAYVMIAIFGENLIRMTTGTLNTEMIGKAVMSLRWHFSFYPMLGVLLCLRMAMQAMGQKIIPAMSSGLELVMKFSAAKWLIPRYGFWGTCITEPVTWTVMMLFLAAAYLKRRKEIFKKSLCSNGADTVISESAPV